MQSAAWQRTRCAASSLQTLSASPPRPMTHAVPHQPQHSAHAHKAAVAAAAAATDGRNSAGATPPAQRPVLLFDVMDTIVSDPFFEHMPRFFSMSFKELLAAKHPTAWIEFENDLIDQEQLFAKFFADGRPFDGAALVQHMVAHYAYIDGMQQLLARLKAAGFALHAMSNYPMWYRLIEDKLQLSEYLQWTFLSCTGPMKGLRKPAPAAYEAVTAHLQLPPQDLIFIDDRQPNVDAAAAAGMGAVKFSGCAAALEQELRARGLVF